MIGAGVVGLAIARELAIAGRETLILERADRFGTGVSSRNSEVIHAGIYYPPGSLKARLCVEGRKLLYDYCERRGVPYRRCGKLVVATEPGRLGELEALHQRALANGVTGIQRLEARAARELEPALRCVAALHSERTGIVDSHGLMRALLEDALEHGASIAYRSPVDRIHCEGGGYRIVLDGEDSPTAHASVLINAAGLDAPRLAGRIDGLRSDLVPKTWICKGSYFSLAAPSPFSRLVYPLPEPGGIGIHLTLDLAGRARFGPDVEWLDAPDYVVDPARASRFYEAIRTYWPGLEDGSLEPGYAGIRPRISGPGEPLVDFRIDGASVHGLRGLVNLLGIESPGLTAALAIAARVR